MLLADFTVNGAYKFRAYGFSTTGFTLPSQDNPPCDVEPMFDNGDESLYYERNGTKYYNSAIYYDSGAGRVYIFALARSGPAEGARRQYDPNVTTSWYDGPWLRSTTIGTLYPVTNDGPLGYWYSNVTALNGSDLPIFTNLQEFNDYITTPTTIYVWKSWNQLAGNSGQYRCNLTMIKDDSIGDISQYVQGSESDFDRLSSQASIWNIFYNTPYDQETRIGWSGNGWVTLTLSEVQGVTPTTVKFTFKFYRPEISSSTPFYTHEYTAITGGDISGRYVDMYLSFVYDADEAVAIFLPVLKNASGVYFWGEFGSSHTEEEMGHLFMWLASSGSPEGDSPYSTGTEDNGGNPGGPMPQSHIPVPAPPSLGGLTSGMITLYCPSSTQLAETANFLWDNSFVNSIIKLFGSPMENIIALYALPCKPLNLPTKPLQIGNVVAESGEILATEYVENRYFQIDMGDLKIKPFWGSYLDYSPYSKMEVYLPGIGIQQLDVDDIMCPSLEDGSLSKPSETTLHLDYTIDLMTGAIVAFLSINGEMRYQFPGKLGYQMTFTGENYTRMIQTFITGTSALLGTAVTGGASAPFSAGAAVAGVVNAMKPDFYRGGNLSGDVSMMSSRTPTLIYKRPNKPKLDDQEKYTGFPSYKIGLLSGFTGYTEVIDCHVEGISCTEEERDQILALLKGGVII